MRTRQTIIGLALLFLASTGASAEELTIVTWNVKDCMSIDDVSSRGDDFKRMADELKPDILIIQEVTSRRVVEKIRERAGLTGYYVACSDFIQSDRADRSAFEVAVISKYPFAQVIEFDPTPDNVDDDDPEELQMALPRGVDVESAGTNRGFLWVRFDGIPLTVFAVHLKSSLGLVGKGDLENAKKREFVIAAVGAGVIEDGDYFPDHSFLVAGDFNVGHSDKKKNGSDLSVDRYGSDLTNGDRYDDTHALLHAGLIAELKMKNLTKGISKSTFPDFPGSPIDNIYVDGAVRDRFEPAATTEGDETYGSDHRPVWTTVKLSDN